MSRRRLVIFAEPRSFISSALVSSVIKACRGRADIELVAIVDTGRDPPRARARAAKIVTKAAVKRLFDAAHPIVIHAPMWRTFHHAANRAGIPVIVPERRSVNDPGFIERLQRELRPDLALSLVCLQIFRDDLLASFASAVNYHNGLLPAYRGLRATGWSVYKGEERTGFSFHRMTTGIDEGPVLHAGSVAVRPRASVLKLEWDKTLVAAQAVPLVLDAMSKDAPGRPQAGASGYYGQSAGDRITTVPDPSLVSWDDLVLRLRAFGAVDMTIGGRRYRVTKVEAIGRSSDGSRWGFRSVDGKAGRPTRIVYLPPRLYGLYRRITAR